MPPIKHHTEAERKKIIEAAQKAVLEDCRKRKEEAESWGPRGPTPNDHDAPVPLQDVGSLLGRTKDLGAVRKIIQRSKAAKTPEERAKNARDLMELYGPLPTPPEEPQTSDSEEEVIPPKVPEKPVGITMREAANDQFRKGQYRESLIAYDRAASQLEGAEAAKCHANKAEAYLRLKDYERAAESASKALELDESNVKARYRRGKAALELGDAAAALEDLGQAAKSGDKASSELFRKALEQQRRAVFSQAVEEETGPYDLEVLVDAYRVGSDDPDGLKPFLEAAQSAGLLSQDADLEEAKDLTDFSTQIYDKSAVPFLTRLRAIRKAVEAQKKPPSPKFEEPWPDHDRKTFSEKFGAAPFIKADSSACLDAENESFVRAVLSNNFEGDDAAFVNSLRRLGVPASLVFAAFSKVPDGRNDLAMHVLRGEDISGELKGALEAIERDAARASSSTTDAVNALETWTCFTAAALDEYGRLASDFDQVAVEYALKAAETLRGDPQRLLKTTQATFDACRRSFGGRPRRGRGPLVRVAMKRAAALAALDKKAAARDALGEAWGGALHLVFRERGDAGDRTALAAEEKEARAALEGLQEPEPEPARAAPLPGGMSPPTTTGPVYSSRCVLRRQNPPE